MKKQDRLQAEMEEADARMSQFMSLFWEDEEEGEGGETNSPQKAQELPKNPKGRVRRLVKDD